jgi:tetratricopeptide (TPR) repeat protein
MSDLRTIHNEAMDLAEAGALAKIRGQTEDATQLLRRAFELEREAAALCADALTLEPTRSVLHRSAASLALDCGEYREAERLIATALSGEPPADVADELRDLLEQAYFHRHLALRGLSLEPEELQLSIAGKAIGFGIAPSEEYVERVQAFEKMVYRTAERKLGLAYREGGNPMKAIKDNFELFVSAPRAASMAVTLKIGRPTKEHQLLLALEGTVESREVIDEIVYCLELMNLDQEEALKSHIEETAYYNNFVALAKKIAPDGEDVNVVGLTVIRNGKKREVPLRKISRGTRRAEKRIGSMSLQSLPTLEAVTDETSRNVEVEGRLRYADSTGDDVSTVKVVDDNGQEHTIIVPEGMMTDIVRPYWDSYIAVLGTRAGDTILLEHIRKVRHRRG